MSTLESAISVAAMAHEGQRDKAGAPYILHPLRIMLRLSTAEERIVAVLHDVVEDCGWSYDDLRREGFSETVIEALASVTRRDGETYEEFVLRAAANPIGRRVKRVDLEDNCDIARIANPAERDHRRIARYHRALALMAEVEAKEAAAQPGCSRACGGTMRVRKESGSRRADLGRRDAFRISNANQLAGDLRRMMYRPFSSTTR